ncbi:protein phosphatase 1, regulatory (inhibitor) subunit 14Ab [Clarias gariepinus]|uniref:protein phosphatase 1, regulatory (inhibitor) subunit 14Ab n=1 Tax=Clarias gariepinus TaxID=13013 RepID=UPI00234DD03D|nr:protein phosphatase 1, regulatory (inhibitor) subunit 14Ab [Clarias gariepinus]
MAANRVGRRYNSKVHSPSRGSGRESGLSVQKRQARVTVKYNRKELQRRLDVEKWIDAGLDELFLGREEHMPEEVNIDELLDLQSDEERTKRLQDILHLCNTNTEAFIKELVSKLHGLQKQEDLHNDGIEHPQLHIFPKRQNSDNSDII